MSIQRDFWLKPFSKDHFPNWACPECGDGVLRPVEKTISFEESNLKVKEAVEQFGHDASSFRYVVLLKCNNLKCQERISSCGYGYVEEDFNVVNGKLLEDDDGAPETKLIDFLVPEYFYPAIKVFPISPKCPEDVTKEIISSFKLFFADPPASANYVRKAVEVILTDRKVKRYTTNKLGKKQSINLHDRIALFQSQQPEIAQKLFAIKWLGNEGSHSNRMTKNDILDAYEILEIVIDDIYVGHRKLVDRKVAQINKSKKPLHPST